MCNMDAVNTCVQCSTSPTKGMLLGSEATVAWLHVQYRCSLSVKCIQGVQCALNTQAPTGLVFMHLCCRHLQLKCHFCCCRFLPCPLQEDRQKAIGVVNVSLMKASPSIATAAACKPGTPFAMITNMAVCRELRGRGISHMLMQSAMKAALVDLDISPPFALLLAYKYYEPAMRYVSNCYNCRCWLQLEGVGSLMGCGLSVDQPPRDDALCRTLCCARIVDVQQSALGHMH